MGEDKQKYVIIGVLLLIIAGAVVGIVSMTGDSRPDRTVERGRRFWCEETHEEFTFGPDDAPDDIRTSVGETGGGMRFTNPKTGKRTLISMVFCPKCEKHFVPEAWKAGGARVRPDDPRAQVICPQCQTDPEQWKRDKHGGKR